MTKEKFKSMWLILSDKIGKNTKIYDGTTNELYNKYFKFYPENKLERILDYIGESSDWFPSMSNIFGIVKEFGYNPPLHEQINQIKKYGIDNVNFIPSEDIKKWI